MSAGNCGNLAVIGWQVPSGRMRVPVVPSGLRKRVVEARGGRQPKLHRPERTLILATEDGLQPIKDHVQIYEIKDCLEMRQDRIESAITVLPKLAAAAKQVEASAWDELGNVVSALLSCI